jgi:PAS domain S-box-containing protein
MHNIKVCIPGGETFICTDANGAKYGPYKPLILGLTIVLAVFAAIYINAFLGIDIVYTHIFYIPIILAGAWYHRKAVYVALLLGATHILINYAVDGIFTYDTFIRAFFFLVIAYFVGSIAKKKDTLYEVVRDSRERLRRMHDTLDMRVRQRTSELSTINESLKNEIVEKRQAEMALRDSEEKFRVLVESSPAAIMLYQEEKLIYVNRATESITGFDRDELLSMHMWDFVHPDSQDMIKQRSSARLRGLDAPTRYEVRIVTKGGDEKWFDISSSLISYLGKSTGLVSGIDVTGRKKAEKALIKSRAILSRAQSIAHVGNWAWDLKTDRMQWSDELFRIFGHQPGDFQPCNDWLISHIHPDDRAMVVEAADKAIKENKLFNIDYRIIAADGSIRYINCVADKLRSDKLGAPAWMYGIKQDITARKDVEEALQDAKSQAELYLDLMGHDINNMNQIGMGFLELALDTLALDDNAKQMISKPLEALESSTRLISNVRKLQRARDGSLLLHRVGLREMIRQLIPRYSNVAGRDIAIRFEENGECHVQANDLLSDVFSNIIGNSIKHSSGALAIHISLKNAMIDDRDNCVVCIEDDGPGIPDDRKETMFCMSNRGKMRSAGSGLGLYLVKTLMDDFHGTVRAEDRVVGDHTKGCRFIISLPASKRS